MDKVIICSSDEIYDSFEDFVSGEKKGEILLPVTVANILEWYGEDSPYHLITGITKKNMDKILYYTGYIVLDPMDTDIRKGKVLTEKEAAELEKAYGTGSFRIGTGAEAVKEYLSLIDCREIYKEMRQQEADAVMEYRCLGESKEDETNDPEKSKRREMLKSEIDRSRAAADAAMYIKSSKDRLFIDRIRLFPVQTRTMLESSVPVRYNSVMYDLEELCERVFIHSNRVRRLIELNAPDIILRNEKRMLQESVDNYICNGLRGNARKRNDGKKKYSLADALKGYMDLV